jgi:hypothetical protein
MTQAFNLSQFANKLNSSGQTDNTGLQNSSVTVTAGTGMSGGGSVALGSSVTLTNAGVTSIVAGTGISVSGATGAVTVSSSASGQGGRGQVFTSSGTFTIPTGITSLKVTVVGAGGGGSGNCSNGSSGGTSSVASGTQTISTISATGGAAGQINTSSSGTSGSGSGGDANMSGGRGGASFGGGSLFGGQPWKDNNIGAQSGLAYGAGGTAAQANQVGGGGGGAAIKWLTSLTPGNTLTVTRGAGGSGADGGGGGANGIIIFEY